VRAVPCLLCFFDIFVYESKRVDVASKFRVEKLSVKEREARATGHSARLTLKINDRGGPQDGETSQRDRRRRVTGAAREPQRSLQDVQYR
jgi:hypothetical protein